MLVEVNGEFEFKEIVLNEEGKILVDFYANWCGPCKMLGPILEQIVEENPEYKIAKVNVDENQDLAQKFGVASIPTLIMFENGSEVDKVIGLRSKADLVALFND